MTLTFAKKIEFARFVSCVNGAGLLKILPQSARRMMTSNAHSVFPEGFTFADDFKPSITRKNNLTCGGIFRGKISRQQIKHILTASKTGRYQRHINS
jgi:hypothetical protein